MDPDPNLPRPVDDSENLRRLREEARRKLDREDSAPPVPRPVYGGPPRTVYGGPTLAPTRRWSLRGILLLALAILAAVLAWFFGRSSVVNPVSVYGGPPPPSPRPDR